MPGPVSPGYLFDRELTRTLQRGDQRFVQRGVTRAGEAPLPGQVGEPGPGHPPLVILKSLSPDYLCFVPSNYCDNVFMDDEFTKS